MSHIKVLKICLYYLSFYKLLRNKIFFSSIRFLNYFKKMILKTNKNVQIIGPIYKFETILTSFITYKPVYFDKFYRICKILNQFGQVSRKNRQCFVNEISKDSRGWQEKVEWQSLNLNQVKPCKDWLKSELSQTDVG